jgi:hypothetical protein
MKSGYKGMTTRNCKIDMKKKQKQVQEDEREEVVMEGLHHE